MSVVHTEINREMLISKITNVLVAHGLTFCLNEFRSPSPVYYVLRHPRRRKNSSQLLLKAMDQLTERYGDIFQELKGIIISEYVNTTIDIESNGTFTENDIHEYIQAVRKALLDNRMTTTALCREGFVMCSVKMGRSVVKRLNVALSNVGIDLGIPHNPLVAKYRTSSYLHEEIVNHIRSIGDVMQNIRKERRLTVQDVAELSGLSRQTISSVEKGSCMYPENKIEMLFSTYGASVEQRTQIAGMLREYRLARARSCVKEDRVFIINTLGDTLKEYIEIVQKTLKDNNCGILDVFDTKYKIIEGTYASSNIKARVISEINNKLRLRNILPKHDNYLFEI